MRARKLYPLIFIVIQAVLLAATAHGAQVGAYYYPWYGPFPGGHTWDQTLRKHLVPPEQPASGYYSSRDKAVIESQIDQSHRGNISFWAMSWWGPGSSEDNTIRNSVLADPRAGELKYAVNYESTGRLGTFANPDYSKFVPDFQYLAQNYFNDPNYLKINGRPVVFIYLTRAYFNTAASQAAVASLRTTMQSQFHVNPYLVGDDVFPGDTNANRAKLWDAITDFDVYGSALGANGSTRQAVAALASQYKAARNTAASVHVGFIPTASPGFDDRAVPGREHNAAPRYLTDVPGSKQGSLFSDILQQAVLPNLDKSADDILMVNSFNEWHEDTQIEATLPAGPTTQDDSGNQSYTQGYSFDGYGDLYLDELKQATVPEPAGAAALLSVLLVLRRRRSTLPACRA